ncbi:MAG: S-methyl-5-thioribose-1-phosphate isomerase [archaeon]|nr:S-methyl-5-thioribose-1-phosphate isomerase [Candidatus Micrarchaeota archaeon]
MKVKVEGKEKHYLTVWMEGSKVFLINQEKLPFSFEIHECKTYREAIEAINNMTVRGAGAVGAAAAFALAQAFIEGNSDLNFAVEARKEIESTRPTAINLFHATKRVFDKAKSSVRPSQTAFLEAKKIADEDAASCKKIGELGEKLLIRDGMKILTHCNAGWLAFVDYGTALSPIYVSHRKGKKVFVFVDETRPKLQGAKLTAWELSNEGVPHSIIPDNAAAHYMSKKEIDLVIVGADRIALNGDSANKIGTLEKAILAKEFNIPFYIAAPTSSIDFSVKEGSSIPIEERSQEEVLFQTGLNENGVQEKFRISNPSSNARNPAFDVTPAKYIKGILTERGLLSPQEIKTLSWK